jgi:shikimate dehydrogenase
MIIRGTTTLIAHIGDPIAPVKSPMIYNPWFAQAGIDAAVIPLGVRTGDYPAFLRSIFAVTNVRGALVTMPHKVTTVALVDDCSAAVRIAGSCNAVLKRPDGSLYGDLFDGAGFVGALHRAEFKVAGTRCLVVGAGGVGKAIAAALAGEAPAALRIYDINAASAQDLAHRLKEAYPSLDVAAGSNDPAGYGLVVNASPLGMNADDPLPVDPARLAPGTLVGDVVMKVTWTPLLRAARERGCRTQIGTEMLYEQIPIYLEFFGFGRPSSDELRNFGG